MVGSRFYLLFRLLIHGLVFRKTTRFLKFYSDFAVVKIAIRAQTGLLVLTGDQPVP
jgi:hypothetical protein